MSGRCFRRTSVGSAIMAWNNILIGSIALLHSLVMTTFCPKASSVAFTPPEDEMSEVVSHCLPRRNLWVSNLSRHYAVD